MAWNFQLPLFLAQAAAEPAAEGNSTLLMLLAAVAVIVGSFVAGTILARAVRMPDYGFKIGLIIFVLAASVVVCIAGWPPKRGIDLSGGVVLIYEVDQASTQPAWMQEVAGKVRDRLNADGGEKAKVNVVGADRIEVTLPPGADVAKAEQKVFDLRNTADIAMYGDGKRKDEGADVLVFRADTKEQKNIRMDDLVTAVSKRINPGGLKELTIRRYGLDQLEVIIPEIEQAEVDLVKRKISSSGLLEFRIVANQNDDKELIKLGERTPGRDVVLGGKTIGRWVTLGKEMQRPEMLPGATIRRVEGRQPEILVRISLWDVDGSHLSRAAPSFDERGQPAVKFSFDSVGAERFGQLTGRNMPDPAVNLKRELGIILDNVMLSAPSINDRIFGEGIINGKFTQQEIDFLVGVLNAGSLPATLRPEPLSEVRISSQLGSDTIRSGSMAMVISTVLILIFMAVYYRFAGIVADIGVIMNVIVTVALMILIKAAFTLPGLAGLVLTVGMAVDANVLIYERMREEGERGASLRMAIRNGYSRATGTIIDSNVTTLITAVVLYIIGTDQIKGFAVTLILGLLTSMFMAIFVSRVIFDVCEKNRWLTKLKMMQLMGVPNLDFIRWRNTAIVATTLVIALGMAAVVSRGKGLLDIDFTGGTSVTVRFKKDKPQDIGDVRESVQTLPDVAVSAVGEDDLLFKVDTSEPDIKIVQAELKKVFGEDLETYTMAYQDLAVIEKPATDPAKPGEGPAISPDSTAPAATTPPATDPAAPADATPPPGEKPVEPETQPAEPAKPEEPAAKPADAPADKPAEPAEPESPQSRLHSPSGGAIELASLDTTQALAALAIAQEPAADTKQPAASDPKVPDAKTEDAQPAAEAKPAEAPAAESKPAESKPASDAKSGEADDKNDAAELGIRSMVGGTRVTLVFEEPISYGPLRDRIKQELVAEKLGEPMFELQNPNYQQGSEARFAKWLLEIMLEPAQAESLVKGIQQKLATTPVFPSASEIGGKVAGNMQVMAIYALLASMVMIVVYVWIRFNNVVFGVAAVIAVFHDALVAVSFLAMSLYLSPYLSFLLVDDFKISLAVVAALLTIVGFSINDTIVIFDRIREVRGKSAELTGDMINLSVNQTLSRTILTSGTVLIASIILYAIGGPGIHAFAFTMVIGVIAGTYSTVYIAAPILLWMKMGEKKDGKSTGAPQTAGAGSGAKNR